MSLFGRVYARCYDRFMDRIDRDGAAEHRRRLVEEAGGEVLEIGAGTGKNLPFYGAAEGGVALEPDPAMRARAHDAVREARVPVEVVEGDAMALPFPDASFDTVVFSLAVHGPGCGTSAGRSPPRAPPRRHPPFLRARPRFRASPGSVAGPPRAPVGLDREGLPPQPGRGGGRGRSRVRRPVAGGVRLPGHAPDRPAARYRDRGASRGVSAFLVTDEDLVGDMAAEGWSGSRSSGKR